MDGCYGFRSLGHKLKVCGTKMRHYILEMVLVLSEGEQYEHLHYTNARTRVGAPELFANFSGAITTKKCVGS